MSGTDLRSGSDPELFVEHQVRTYLTFDPAGGYPAGESGFYECTECNSILPSRPDDGRGCECGNIFVDVAYGRLAVRDNSKIKAFSAG